MTEDEFRKKMKELSWTDKEIEDFIRMYNLKLSLGLKNISLQEYLGPRTVVSSYTRYLSEDNDD